MTSKTSVQYEELAVRSRRYALVSLLGLCIILGAFGFAAYYLDQLSSQVHAQSAELEKIKEQVAEANSKLARSRAELAARSTEIEIVEAKLKATQDQLAGSREAVALVTQGINEFHQANYLAAIDAYDQALRLDRNNPYIANLKGYAEFKAHLLPEAISTLKRSVEISPSYAWGFFDLARALCANGQFSEAKEAINHAVALRPGMLNVIKNDGEFARLCRPIWPPKQ